MASTPHPQPTASPESFLGSSPAPVLCSPPALHLEPCSNFHKSVNLSVQGKPDVKSQGGPAPLTSPTPKSFLVLTEVISLADPGDREPPPLRDSLQPSREALAPSTWIMAMIPRREAQGSLPPRLSASSTGVPCRQMHPRLNPVAS